MVLTLQSKYVHVNFAPSRYPWPGMSANTVIWAATYRFQVFPTLPISESCWVIQDALDLQERLETKDWALCFCQVDLSIYPLNILNMILIQLGISLVGLMESDYAKRSNVTFSYILANVMVRTKKLYCAADWKQKEKLWPLMKCFVFFSFLILLPQSRNLKFSVVVWFKWWEAQNAIWIYFRRDNYLFFSLGKISMPKNSSFNASLK